MLPLGMLFLPKLQTFWPMPGDRVRLVKESLRKRQSGMGNPYLKRTILGCESPDNPTIGFPTAFGGAFRSKTMQLPKNWRNAMLRTNIDEIIAQGLLKGWVINGYTRWNR